MDEESDEYQMLKPLMDPERVKQFLEFRRKNQEELKKSDKY